MPFWLLSLPSLVSLDLSSNLLAGSLDSLTQLSGLAQLALDDNRFSAWLSPEVAAALSSLDYFSASGNQLYGTIPEELFSAPCNLQVLDLSRNALSGTLPPVIDRCLYLRLLQLSRNFMTGSVPASLAYLPILERLFLGMNKLQGSLPSGLASASFQPYLQILDLQSNGLNGTIPALTSASLVSVVLANNQLVGSFPSLVLQAQDRIAHSFAESDSSFVVNVDVSNNLLSGMI